MSLCLLAGLAALSRVELAGQSAGSYLSGLVISPADARKAPRQPRLFGGDLRHTPDAFPAFPPLPSPAVTPPLVPRVPQGPAEAHAPSFFSELKSVLNPPQPGSQQGTSAQQATKSSGGVRPGGDMPGPRTREPAADGRWDPVVRVAAPYRGTDAVKPVPQPAAAPGSLPASTGSQAEFQRVLEKLASRPAFDKVATAPSRPRPRTSPTKPANSTGSAQPAPRRLGGRVIGELLPPVGSFRSNEVLAINVSAEGLGKARAGSYDVAERIELPEFGLTITRLRPPEALNAITGRERLYDLLPEDGFTLNRVYASYRPGAGRSGGGVALAAQSGNGCPSERCFGSALINWQPRLAACARDIKVGIVDTGFDQAHPAFAGVRYTYAEFLPDGSPRASNQHGTGVLSLLAGNAASGTPGLIPDASYVIANAFHADAEGQPVSDTLQMLQALHWLKKNGVAVVNLSFAGPEDDLLHHAVRELTKSGAVVVAAAGNEGPAAPPSYPAAYPEVIAVTAVDRNLAAYRYANRGEHIDLAAPGVDVWTAIPGRLEGPQTGTSFAVPYVTAVVAVTLPETHLASDNDEQAAKRHALWQLRGHVRSLGSQGRDATFGAGLIQAPASCGPPPAVAVAAADAGDAAQPWPAGTVVRAVDPAPHEPLLVGSWVSTVRAVSGKSLSR